MAAPYPQTIAAQLSGAVIKDGFLIRLGFVSGEMRLWSGVFDFTDLNGETWVGAGNVATMSAIAAGPGQAIQEMVFTLFGSADMLSKFESDAANTAGREVNVYQQFFDARRFDDRGNWVEGKALDAPTQMFWGLMGPLIADRPTTQPGDPNPWLRSITMRAANAFINRRKPSYAFYSQQDQIARSVGHNDNMFINSSRMALTTVRWPKF